MQRFVHGSPPYQTRVHLCNYIQMLYGSGVVWLGLFSWAICPLDAGKTVFSVPNVNDLPSMPPTF